MCAERRGELEAGTREQRRVVITRSDGSKLALGPRTRRPRSYALRDFMNPRAPDPHDEARVGVEDIRAG